jgi:hypothetical protein
MHVFRFLPRLIFTLSLAACASLPTRNLAPPADIRSNILNLADREWQAFGGQTIYRRRLGR